MIFLLLFLIPALVALVGFLLFSNRITLKEFLIQMVVQVVLVGIIVGVLYYQDTHDTEVWNGRVVEKIKDRVSCEHDYRCNCREECSGSGEDRSCHEVCDTCYEHPYDYDWILRTSNNERIEIYRVDRQGTRTPPRWAAANIGDTTAVTHGYTNYIKAASDTLFRHQGLMERFEKVLPKYPLDIKDYHHLNRVITIGYPLSNESLWASELESINADLGAKKQVNIVLIVVNSLPSEFLQALEQHWLGGKKNDVVIVLSAKDKEIEWAGVLAWAKDDIFKVKMRDSLLDLKTLDRVTFFPVVREVIDKNFIRKPMEDFAYLKGSIVPTGTQLLIAFIVSLLLSIGLSVFFYYSEDLE